MTHAGMPARRGHRHDEAGFALFYVVLIVLLLASMAAGALVLSNIDLRSSAHYKTGRQAFYAAESGILHALSAINGRGVVNFQAEVAEPASWNALFGTAARMLPSDGMSTYSVAVAASVADPWNRGVLTATGGAPLEAERVLTVLLRKGQLADQGALYLANDNVDPDFGARDQFEIDGRDHALTPGFPLNPTGPLRPGIATRNDDVTDRVKEVLSDPQKEKIQGLGFSLDPLTPSVMNTSGPTVADLESIVQRLLANNPVVTDNSSNMAAGVYGTIDNPQITHMTNANVHLNGSMQGAGILIIDGEFTVNGSADFIGWIIVRGATRLRDDTLVDGNSMIRGSLWTGDLRVEVGGSAYIDFCRACMELADRAGNGNNVPRVMAVASWREGP